MSLINRDYAISFLEVLYKPYDFEKFCRQMKQIRISYKYLRSLDFTEPVITDYMI